MERKELRDRENQYLGCIEQVWPGRLEGRSKSNRSVGWYDINRDETYDESNGFYGKGNLLSVLIAAEKPEDSFFR